MQANHLGHFVLSTELAAARMAAKAAAPLRVVLLSSMAHTGGFIDYDDLHATKRYVPFKCYAQSKLANVMTAAELHRRCAAAHAGACRCLLYTSPSPRD